MLRLLCAAIGTLIASAAFAEAHDGPPLDLLKSNIQDTPYTASVRIESVQAAREAQGSPTGRTGYITFRVRATVVETIKGAGQAHIEYLETREAPAEGPRPGALLVVSLKEGGDGAHFVPDNGYVFPATPQVLRRARAIARANHRPQGPAPPHGAAPESSR